jgi:hypothetical protein
MANSKLEAKLFELESANEKLEARAERIKAILEIMNLQSRFNLWLEAGHFERIWNELFACKNPKVRCEIGESGVYEGPASVKRLWMALANREPRRGYMAMIMPMTPYIVVAKDGKTAKGMWHAFGPHADYATPSPGDQQKLTAYWFFGKYDNEFVKEDGKWKFLSLHTIVYIRTPYDAGWTKEPDCARWQVPRGAPPDANSTLVNFYHPDGVFYPLPEPPESQ